MPQAFKSWLSYGNFQRATAVSRYMQSDDTKAFLETVLETSQSRRRAIPEGFPLWRAQPGHGLEETIYRDGEVAAYETCALPEDKMKPRPEFAVEGRANPKGTLVLYLATHRNTAMAEVAHWSGPEVSVARFKTRRPLTLINFTLDKRPTEVYVGCEPAPELRETYVWADINQAFSRPVGRSDSSADYVPTQILAELFKSASVDGLAYQSSLGSCHEGHNVVLFDPDAVSFHGCTPYEVTQIAFTFNQVGHGY